MTLRISKLVLIPDPLEKQEALAEARNNGVPSYDLDDAKINKMRETNNTVLRSVEMKGSSYASDIVSDGGSK